MPDTKLFEIFFAVWQIFILVIIAHSIAVLASEKYIRWLISWRNNMGGIKTNITKQTLTVHKISAVMGIIIGLVMLVASYYVFGAIQKDWEKYDNGPRFDKMYEY